MRKIKIGNKSIGEGESTFVVAELSANHLQKFDLAVKTIKVAKEAGADAIKLQTYTPDTMTIDCKNEHFRIKGGLWDKRTLYDLYKGAYTPWDWQPKLKKLAERLGLICFSSAFDKTSVDFLENMDVSVHKVSSFEIRDIPLIEYVASKGKPIMLSTGIAELSDIEEAVNACKRMGNDQIILLKCTSAYPTPSEETNLMTIPDMADRFKTIVGLSDHSITTSTAIAAVSLGAKIVEKHFILDRKLGGPDAAFSLEPKEFKEMVSSIREVENALGKPCYDLSAKVKKSLVFSRSLFCIKDMKAGDTFTEDNIRSIRPGYGLHPKYLKGILGKKVKKNVKRGTPLSWDMVR